MTPSKKQVRAKVREHVKSMQAALGRLTVKRQRGIREDIGHMKADLEELRRIRQSVAKLLNSDACVGGAGSMLDGIAVLLDAAVRDQKDDIAKMLKMLAQVGRRHRIK